MFRLKPESNPELDEAIRVATEQLNDYSPAEDDYHTVLARIERLYALKNQRFRWSVSPDTMALVVGNVLITGMVVGHERAGMITSRFSQFIMKATR